MHIVFIRWIDNTVDYIRNRTKEFLQDYMKQACENDAVKCYKIYKVEEYEVSDMVRNKEKWV